MRPVHIQWVDSTSQYGWIQDSEVCTDLEIINTVGLLFKKDRDAYTVVLSAGETSGLVSGTIIIPKSAIKQVKYL